MRSHQAPDTMATVTSKYGGSSCPQWMKTLEQKYQRLHMKIAYSTSMVNSKYPLSSGRAGHDPRLLRTVNKREISALSMRGSRKVSATSDPGFTISQARFQNPSDKRINMESENSSDRRQSEPFLPPPTEEGTDKGPRPSSNSSRNSSNNKEDCFDEEAEEEQTFDLSMVQYDKSGTCETKIFEGNNVKQRSGNGCVERSMKTSTSRISNNTSKSCPAVMESAGIPHPARKKGKHNTKGFYRDRPQHGQRHMKVFSRMSMEAQHAITETLKEMGIGKNEKQQNDENGKHVDSKFSSQQEFTSNVPKDTVLTKSFTDLDNYPYFRPATPCESYPDFEEIHGAVLGADAYSDSEISLSPHNRLQSARSRQTRLPDISGADSGSKVYNLQNSKPCRRLRLPGVGKYDVTVKREETFEITPPGFDVRYQDMTIGEERESETPPLDIRERAIQKCNDWLAKHTPR